MPDGTLRIWDVATQREIVAVSNTTPVLSVAFSPDGRSVAMARGDLTAHVADLHFATMAARGLLEEICTRRLGPLATLTRDEMRLAGYPATTPLLDVCTAGK